MKEQLAHIEELQELSDSQKVDYMKLEAQIKLIKKNNAQAVVDKHTAMDNLREHLASHRDSITLREEHAEAILEKDAQLEVMQDEHTLALSKKS